MKKSDLSSIASEYMKIWNAGNENVLDTFAAKDLEVKYTHFEKTYIGIPEYKSILKMTYGFFPDLKIILKQILPAENESIATVVWEYNGTHKNGNLFGAEPSGKRVTVTGITILEIEHGLVKKEPGIVDNLGLAMQLGIKDFS